MTTAPESAPVPDRPAPDPEQNDRGTETLAMPAAQYAGESDGGTGEGSPATTGYSAVVPARAGRPTFAQLPLARRTEQTGGHALGTSGTALSPASGPSHPTSAHQRAPQKPTGRAH
jgi:hypothetical protein